MRRKVGFSVRESGVGGRVVVVPMAREGVGGWVGRRVRMWEEWERERGSGKMY